MYLRRSSLQLLRSVGVLAAFFAISVVAKAQTPVPVPSAKGVSVGLVVDNSGSYRSIFDRVLGAADSLVDGLGPQDETFLVTFVDSPKIALRQEMTGEKTELKDAVDNMFIQGGPTAILDAVVFASKYMAAQGANDPDRRRVLVLITDGDERGSTATIEEAVRAAKDARVSLFVLGLFEEKFYQKVIDRLVRETGGAKFVPKFPKDTSEAVNSLLAAIRTKEPAGR